MPSLVLSVRCAKNVTNMRLAIQFKVSKYGPPPPHHTYQTTTASPFHPRTIFTPFCDPVSLFHIRRFKGEIFVNGRKFLYLPIYTILEDKVKPSKFTQSRYYVFYFIQQNSTYKIFFVLYFVSFIYNVKIFRST